MKTAKYLFARSISSRSSILRVPFSVLAIGFLLMAGCTNAPIEGIADPYTPAQINLTNTDLRGHTAFGKPKLSKDESGILHVDVPIRSTTNRQLYVDYRVSFYDHNNMLIEGPTGWTTVTIPPNDWQDIVVNGASPRATDFHMDLRYAH